VLYEFALAPEIFDASKHENNRALEIVLEQVLTMLHTNGLIADLQEGVWRKDVGERVLGLSQTHAKKVERLLQGLARRNRLGRRVATGNDSEQTGSDWYGLAVASHRKDNFHGVILTETQRALSRSVDPSLVSLPKACRYLIEKSGTTRRQAPPQSGPHPRVG